MRTPSLIKAVATADRERFEVALLYSCATDNSIYRKLAETCDAILYRGAPYHQQQYAYGIKVHVGPVTGCNPRWLTTERMCDDYDPSGIV